MKSFDKWFNETTRELAQPEQPRTPFPSLEGQLPEGVWDKADGSYWATCRSCGRDYELVYGPKDFTEEYNLCGGGPSCIP
jgi:hypothetical protein